MNKARVKIKLRSYDSRLLDKFVREVVMTAKRNGAVVNGPIPLPKKISRFTVNRSVHVHKKSREQFQYVVYKRLLKISSFNAQLMQTLTNFQLPAGVNVKVEVESE